MEMIGPALGLRTPQPAGGDSAARGRFNSARRHGAFTRRLLFTQRLLFVQRLLLVALCRILDAVTGFFHLLPGLLQRFVDLLADVLCRAFLFLAAG